MKDASHGCPPYESAQSIHSHHGQIWAGTPPHFIERLHADFDYREDDVWIVSYPRSGTSWTYEIVCTVLNGGDIEKLQKAQDGGKILRFLPVEVGCEASVTERLKSWKALPSPRVIPTHVPFRLFPEQALRRGKRLFLQRDPRDVAVSLYHFHRSHKLLGFYKGTWDDFFECFISGRVIYGSWFDHTLGWLPPVRREEAMLLQYEEMLHHPSSQIERIAAYLGAPISSSAVEAVVRHTSFKSMRENTFANREGNPIMDSSVAPFLRKGITGDWENHFTEEQARRFQAEWERSMGTVH